MPVSGNLNGAPDWDALHHTDIPSGDRTGVECQVPMTVSGLQRGTDFILRWIPTPHHMGSSPDSSSTLWKRLPLTAKHGHPAYTMDAWTQVSEWWPKFHSKARWDAYQHRNLTLAHLTSGKWAQLHITRTITIVGSFIVNAKRQMLRLIRDWFS